MENRWTLHVENFGRIERADVAVSPLTLFVGDNNSGKSYLMSLIYALLNGNLFRKFDLCEDSPYYQNCADWLLSGMERATVESGVILSLQDEGIFSQWSGLLNAVLKKNRALISTHAFNTEMPIGDISVTLSHARSDEFEIMYDTEEETDDESASENGKLQYVFWVRATPSIGQPFFTGASLEYADYQAGDVSFFIQYFLEYLLKWDFTDFFSSNGVAFLPTSRTGFLLTYPSLMKDAFEYKYRKESETAESLTRPCSDFLTRLASISQNPPNKQFTKLTHFIQEAMMEGHINRKKGPLSAYSYRPSASDVDIPLYLSSGVVTELTPLLLFLKYSRNLSTLFIEEPEMSLHPALQKRMAQVLIRLSNLNVPVFVTTHSDTILQHVNDMIMLSNQPEKRRKTLKREFSYDDSDLISAENISVYEFENLPNGKSILHSCQCGAYGFEVPKLIDALEQMLKESRAFEREDDD